MYCLMNQLWLLHLQHENWRKLCDINMLDRIGPDPMYNKVDRNLSLDFNGSLIRPYINCHTGNDFSVTVSFNFMKHAIIGELRQ